MSRSKAFDSLIVLCSILLWAKRLMVANKMWGFYKAKRLAVLRNPRT